VQVRCGETFDFFDYLFIKYDTLIQGLVIEKEVWKHNQKTSHFQQHIKLIFKSVFNEVFTFIALQTKIWKK